jgi:hypothetical protein
MSTTLVQSQAQLCAWVKPKRKQILIYVELMEKYDKKPEHGLALHPATIISDGDCTSSQTTPWLAPKHRDKEHLQTPGGPSDTGPPHFHEDYYGYSPS